MKPFLRTAVIWALAALLGFAWWMLRGGSSTRGFASSSALVERAIFADGEAIDVDAVQRIRIERRGEPALLLQRRESEAGPYWVQVEPVTADLDDWSARRLIIEAAQLTTNRPPFEGTDPRELGFDPPAARLEFESPQRTWRLEFGRRGVAGRAFVRREGGAVEVVAAPLHERAVETDAREWRSRVLFPSVLGDPERIAWTLLDGVIELERRGNRWRVAGPIKTRADSLRVEEFLVALGRARSDGFLVDEPAELAPFGLDPSVASLAVTFRAPEGSMTRTLRVGAPLGVGTSDRFALIEERPTLLRLAAATQGVLFPRIETLIDPVAAGVRAADVKRIEIRSVAGPTIELERQLDGWTASIEGAPAIPSPPQGPQRLLALLCAERAPEIAIGDLPADRLAATVILFGFDLAPLDVVRIVHDPRSGKWGFENGDGVLRIHPPTASPPIDATSLGL